MIYKKSKIYILIPLTLVLLPISTLFSQDKKNQNSPCIQYKSYLRCLDGYYKKIDDINIRTNAPVFVARLKETDLENLSYYFTKFTYYSIKRKRKAKQAIKYQYYKNQQLIGEYYFNFFNGKSYLSKAIWYSPKGYLAEVHAYQKRTSRKTYQNTFSYYNDFGVLIRKVTKTFKGNVLISSKTNTNFIIDNHIISEDN